MYIIDLIYGQSWMLKNMRALFIGMEGVVIFVISLFSFFSILVSPHAVKLVYMLYRSFLSPTIN
jgi:hypothetical protein